MPKQQQKPPIQGDPEHPSLFSPGLVRLDLTKGYTKDNIEVRIYALAILNDAGYSVDEIEDFVRRLRESKPISQQEFLAAKLEEVVRLQPEFATLRKTLLEHGGDVVPPIDWDDGQGKFVTGTEPDLGALLEHGHLMKGPVVCRSRGMEPHRCHENISELWLRKRKRDALTGICTGYCFYGGLWRQHSWGIRKGSLLETTAVEGEKHFGVVLTGIDADVWAFKRLFENKGKWSLFLTDPDFLTRVDEELERRRDGHRKIATPSLTGTIGMPQ